MRSTKWNREIILQQLNAWQASGVPVQALWRQDRALASSAAAIFGSWRAALAAAGIQSARQPWSRERIIDDLRKCRQDQQPIGAKLRSAAKREFGSIAKAYAAAGLQPRRVPQPQREWTQAQTIAAIQARQRSGASLSATHREDRVLYAASKRLHGSWTAALKAAGIAPPAKPLLTEKQVIERIRARKRGGRPLTNISQQDPLLAKSARKRFGGWRKALLAAGCTTTIPRRWSKRAVVEAIRARHEQDEPLSAVWRQDRSLFRAAVTHFGNWGNAMRAAGLQPIPRERWTKTRVLEKLQVWSERCGGSNLREIDPNLSAAAGRLFGSYHAALEAAGLEPSPRFWTERRVVAAIQDRYIARSPRHIDGLGDLRLAIAAKRRFGSWQAAVEAAGLTSKIVVKKPLRRWSPDKVIREIQVWHRSGRPLAEVSRSYQSLGCAAKTWFGSWGAAVLAAGLFPQRRVWSHQAVLDEILDRYHNGRSLSSGRPENTNLAAVAIRYFGSWRQAIAAAGVPSQRADNKGA